MIFASPGEIVAAKHLALEAFTRWKVEQLLPRVQEWADEGADRQEIEERLDELRDEFNAEARRTLRLVTILALGDGAFHG